VNTLVHTYLYTRKTYPEQIFERKFEYNCQVYTSRHDALTTYISTHLSVIFDWLKQGKLSHFVVCLQDEYTRGTIERLVFKVEPINADIYESSRISNDAENEESQTSALLRLSRIDYDIPAKTNTNMDIEGNGTGSATFFTLLAFPRRDLIGTNVFCGNDNLKEESNSNVKMSNWMATHADRFEVSKEPLVLTQGSCSTSSSSRQRCKMQIYPIGDISFPDNKGKGKERKGENKNKRSNLKIYIERLL